jgi:hypothetical protein
MTPLHVILGISGAVMVLPRDGLRDKTGKLLHYDHVYYIGENDFYVPRGEDGKFNCGVRVVEGEHRGYVTDFVRDARGGGCAAGKPPSNLGFRLVREDNGIATIASMLRRLMPSH